MRVYVTQAKEFSLLGSICETKVPSISLELFSVKQNNARHMKTIQTMFFQEIKNTNNDVFSREIIASS